MMTMRARYVPEDQRSTIINVFRIPLNFFVCIILWKVSEFPLGAIFALCSIFLVLAALCQMRLAAITSGAHNKHHHHHAPAGSAAGGGGGVGTGSAVGHLPVSTRPLEALGVKGGHLGEAIPLLVRTKMSSDGVGGSSPSKDLTASVVVGSHSPPGKSRRHPRPSLAAGISLT
jgi:hypothetical protein